MIRTLRQLWRSVGFRLAFYYGLLVAITMLAALAIVYMQTVGVLQQRMVRQVEASVQQLMVRYDARGADGVAGEISNALSDGRNSDNEIYLLTDRAGNKLAGNLDQVPSAAPDAGDGVHRRVVRAGQTVIAYIVLRPLPDGGQLVVGHDLRDQESIESLVASASAAAGIVAVLLLIGGTFVTGRNVRGRTADQLRDEIRGLQALRRDAGLPPLVVATDQEGGGVSRLSPLVQRQPALSTLLDADVPDGQLSERARAYGAQQGRALAALGITLNFSPVVDLRPGRAPGRWDFHTRIEDRAISSDPAVTTQVALAYAQGLESAGVRGTLKHFPGLAGVTADTHHFAAELRTPVARLAAQDWKPFQEVSKQSDAAIMLGHVILAELDALYPVSFSRRIVQQLIRGEWGYQGLLVTDDLTMGAAYNRGLCEATVRALDAGVDLLLIAFDHDKYFDAMHCAHQAAGPGAQRVALDLKMLERRNAQRLQSFR